MTEAQIIAWLLANGFTQSPSKPGSRIWDRTVSTKEYDRFDTIYILDGEECLHVSLPLGNAWHPFADVDTLLYVAPGESLRGTSLISISQGILVMEGAQN